MNLNNTELAKISTLLEILKQVNKTCHDYLFKELYQYGIVVDGEPNQKYSVHICLENIFNKLWEDKYKHASLINQINKVYIEVYGEELDCVENEK
jgi:hypothetical protein